MFLQISTPPNWIGTLWLSLPANTVVARWPCISLVGCSNPRPGLWCLSCLMGRSCCGRTPQGWACPANVLESIFIDEYRNWNPFTLTLTQHIAWFPGIRDVDTMVLIVAVTLYKPGDGQSSYVKFLSTQFTYSLNAFSPPINSLQHKYVGMLESCERSEGPQEVLV